MSTTQAAAMPLPSHSTQHGHGSSRSLVRLIGNSIPIDTGRRLHVQLPMSPDSPQSSTKQDSDAEGLTIVSYLRNPGHVISKTVGGLFTIEEEEVEEEREGEDSAFNDSGMETILEGEEEEEGAENVQKQETLDKISALEDELSRLKAQIAVYAMSEVSVPAAPPPPPVAPPPPPTSTPAPHKPPQPVHETKRGESQAFSTPNANLSHVLQDIGSVKLRSVPSMVRSPGGTPLRKVQETREAASNDPAAIIAQALRKKFAHNVFQDSPDKENLERSADTSSSGFESPAGKLFN